MKLAQLRSRGADSHRAQAGGSLHGYQPELDGVRFLAFFIVFLHHVMPPGNMDASWAATTGPWGLHWPTWRYLFAWAASSAAGMCLFFALSAYLITGLLLAERDAVGVISLKKFYIRRILRIWPLHLLGIAIGVAVAILRHRAASAVAFVWFIFLAGNVYCGLYGWIVNPMTVLWSISLEEQFYLFWPALMRFLSRARMAIAAVVIIAVANVQLWYFGAHHAKIDTTVWTNTLTEFEMFATGILLAVMRKENRKHRPLAGLCLVLVSPVLWMIACMKFGAIGAGAGIVYARSAPSLIAGYAVLALGCATTLWGATLIGPRFIPRWLAGLGKISYGLYVYHVLVINTFREPLLRRHVPHATVITATVSLAIVIPLAKLSYKFFEAPFLRIKERFTVVKSRPV